MTLASILDWFAGDGKYMKLVHCMGHDTFWIVTTVALDLAVACGYGLIAMHWWKNQRLLPDIPAKRALAHMRNIFLFCGICGYAFIPIKMFWPAWRLYDCFMLALVWFTWRYALNARELRVVYRELGRSNELERDLETSREEIRRRSWFLTAVSHDLRNPLNTLMLHAKLAELKVGAEGHDELRESIHAIKTNAAATARLLDSLMEVATLELQDAKPARDEIDLRALLEPAMERAAILAPQDRAIRFRINCPSAVTVRSDRTKLERVIDNLLTNAVKYTSRGEVGIDVDVVEESLEIHIIDTGCGIDPVHHAKVFDEFYQVGNFQRDPAKGFGLGLAIARRLIQQLGGELSLESAPGKGSRFSILLHGAVVHAGAASAAPADSIKSLPSGAVSAPGTPA
jgi:signal transduction histidine kinase